MISNTNASIFNSHESNRQNLINSTFDLVNILIPSSILYQNQKTVDEIYLNTISSHIIALDSTQINQLSAIAYQCPLEGGDAVYQARGLLLLGGINIYLDDEDLCSFGNNSSLRHYADKFTYSLYPNPASESIQLTINSENDKGYHMMIYSTYGQIVYESHLSGKSISSLINLNGFHNGLYFYTIQCDDGSDLTGKFIVQ